MEDALGPEEHGYDQQPCDGSRESFIPQLGEAQGTEEEDLFHAYIFTLPSGKKAGYVRIPTYHPMDMDAHAVAFAKLMAKFQKKTDMLVIDQNNNPGGSVLYLYSLVGALSDQPMQLPKHRIMLTQASIFEAVESIGSFQQFDIQDDETAIALMGKTLHGYPVTKSFIDQLTSYYYKMYSEWSEGRRLTDPPRPLHRRDCSKPQEIHKAHFAVD